MKSIGQILLGLSLALAMGWAHAQGAAETEGDGAFQKELAKLAWVHGPARGDIAGKAAIQVPEGFVYLGESDTDAFLQLAGNLPSPDHYLVAPDDLRWFAVFSFDPSGYVKDDEKIDAQALLSDLKKSDGPANKQRRAAGLSELYTDGWQVAPHYDTDSNRLEWGLKLRTSDGEEVVNYTSRLLGRSGVMSAVLVSDEETLAKDTQEFKRAALARFDFNSGEKYAEFKQGDKIAAYGLGALVLGGAAAAAGKKGFWAALGGVLAAGWKFVAAAAVALLAGIGRFFKKKDS